jgi:CheY-like chemotaxis protein
MAVAPGFDIVLMDCRLPVMNGLLATAAIRQWESLHGAPRIAILGLTASSMPEERLGCLDAGMDDVLSKPLLFPKLYDALLRWKPASV